jgi:hypothetical protein
VAFIHLFSRALATSRRDFYLIKQHTHLDRVPESRRLPDILLLSQPDLAVVSGARLAHYFYTCCSPPREPKT